MADIIYDGIHLHQVKIEIVSIVSNVYTTDILDAVDPYGRDIGRCTQLRGNNTAAVFISDNNIITARKSSKRNILSVGKKSETTGLGTRMNSLYSLVSRTRRVVSEKTKTLAIRTLVPIHLSCA